MEIWNTEQNYKTNSVQLLIPKATDLAISIWENLRNVPYIIGIQNNSEWLTPLEMCPSSWHRRLALPVPRS